MLISSSFLFWDSSKVALYYSSQKTPSLFKTACYAATHLCLWLKQVILAQASLWDLFLPSDRLNIREPAEGQCSGNGNFSDPHVQAQAQIHFVLGK